MTTLSPKERWLNLLEANPTPSEVPSKAAMIMLIDLIDRDTEWQEVEPQWWLEMREYQSKLLGDKQ
jgi:hypothetical protein